jgi:Domain of unknown function (DUF5069)/Cupin domain
VRHLSGTAAAKDLAAQEPRGLDAELDGYAWLPRMFDKARATLAGTAGRYQFGCPVDHTCLARLGVAVQEGAARFFLGEQQARIVRAGEIVRVPAGVPHRWTAEPGDPLRMVAAYGAAQIITVPA